MLDGFQEGDAELVLKVETPEGDFFGEGRVVFFGDGAVEDDFFGEEEESSDGVLGDKTSIFSRMFCSSSLSRFLLVLAGGDCHRLGCGDLDGDWSLGVGDCLPGCPLR